MQRESPPRRHPPGRHPPGRHPPGRHRVPHMSVEFILIGLAAISAIAALFVVLRTVAPVARELQYLRILSEQTRDGTRTEAETTRAHLRAQSTEGIERVTALRGALDTSLEQMRTVLTREQGELRLALSEAQHKASEQIVEQSNATRALLEAKLKELREGNEGKLAEIQKSVNE